MTKPVGKAGLFMCVALENVALHKPAVQEIPDTGAYAGLCTDGYNDGVYYDDSACCMLSGKWWIVDLANVYNISYVIIYRRTDGSFPNNAVVEGFLQYPPMCPGSGVECGRVNRALLTAENISCSTPVEMRYLRVSSTSPSPSMCEVEAYGSLVRTISSGDCPRVEMTPQLNKKLTGAVSTSTITTTKVACGFECVKGAPVRISLPSSGKTSHHISRLLKQQAGIDTYFTTATPIKTIIRANGRKHPSTKQEPKGVVYNISCNCGSNYIRETSRPLNIRIKEHKISAYKADKKSVISEYITKFPDHKINWDTIKTTLQQQT
ncbi:uncharacterized protein [Haliotis asinina]|uniref:uncharacterized protein n=1 Tax=Haliotis asinina TaxID=109174 RepID=UPI003531A933